MELIFGMGRSDIYPTNQPPFPPIFLSNTTQILSAFMNRNEIHVLISSCEKTFFFLKFTCKPSVSCCSNPPDLSCIIFLLPCPLSAALLKDLPNLVHSQEVTPSLTSPTKFFLCSLSFYWSVHNLVKSLCILVGVVVF